MENKQKNYKQCDMCKVDEATSLCPQCFANIVMNAISSFMEEKKIKITKRKQLIIMCQ